MTEQQKADAQKQWILALRDHIQTNLRYGGAVEILSHGRLRIMLYLDEHRLNFLERHFLLDQHHVWGPEFLRSMFGELHFLLFASTLARHTASTLAAPSSPEGTLLDMSKSLWGADEDTKIGQYDAKQISESVDGDAGSTSEQDYDFLRKTKREAVPRGLKMNLEDEKTSEMDATQAMKPPAGTLPFASENLRATRAQAIQRIKSRERQQSPRQEQPTPIHNPDKK
jgi:hypothetical protein